MNSRSLDAERRNDFAETRAALPNGDTVYRRSRIQQRKDLRHRSLATITEHVP